MTEPTIQEILVKNLKDYTDLNHDQVIFIADQMCHDIEKFHNPKLDTIPTTETDNSTGNRGVGDSVKTEGWLKETIDMLVRTRADPRTEVNDQNVSQWAKSPKTKKALKSHGITYDQLMEAYRKRRDKVA